MIGSLHKFFKLSRPHRPARCVCKFQQQLDALQREGGVQRYAVLRLLAHAAREGCAKELGSCAEAHATHGKDSVAQHDLGVTAFARFVKGFGCRDALVVKAWKLQDVCGACRRLLATCTLTRWHIYNV